MFGLRRFAILAVSCSLIAVGGPSWAQSCSDGAGTTSQAAVMCAQSGADAERLRVNQRFLEWMRVITHTDDVSVAVKAEKAEPFVKSQKDWETFVVSACAAEASLWKGGTLQGAREADCRSRLSQERIRYIEDMIAWPLP